MNALIKVIITTVIGFFGSMEGMEENGFKKQADHSLLPATINVSCIPTNSCRLEEILHIKLKNIISS